MPAIVFYISNHGFGHATRQIALIQALRRLHPDRREIIVRSGVPSWVFTDEVPGLRCLPASIDVGMLQSNGLDINMADSLSAHEKLVGDWDWIVQQEADWLSEVEASLVLGDIPPAAFAAAERASVISWGISNFNWSWIVSRYADEESRWTPIAQHYAKAYSAAEGIFRLPFACPLQEFKQIIDAPLLVRRSELDKKKARKLLNLKPEERRKVVLVSFGGYGTGELPFGRSDDLSDFIFVAFSEKPEGFRGEWIALPHRTPIRHVDLLAAMDGAIVKPGYGVFSEAIAHRVRTLYLPRENFPEVPFMLEDFKKMGLGGVIPREDFYAGRWRNALEHLFSIPDRWPNVPLNGAEMIAEKLLGPAEA